MLLHSLLQTKQQRTSAAGGPGGAAAADLSAQLQALRQELEAEQAARAAAEVRVEFLKGKVRDVAERSKQRGNMLAQLALAARRVAEAKQQLEVAEGEMQDALAAAEEYLQVSKYAWGSLLC
jgi:chromosome segregation ATPase